MGIWDQPNRRSSPSLGSQRTVDISLNDPDVELLPLRRSPLRSFIAKFLFTAIFATALALLSYELSTAYHIPWLDPRNLVAKARLLAHSSLLTNLWKGLAK
jgi:hypothetical protein